jgi:hypothetical protein
MRLRFPFIFFLIFSSLLSFLSLSLYSNYTDMNDFINNDFVDLVENPSLEDITKYYIENSIDMTNVGLPKDFIDNYFNLSSLEQLPPKPQSPVPAPPRAPLPKKNRKILNVNLDSPPETYHTPTASYQITDPIKREELLDAAFSKLNINNYEISAAKQVIDFFTGKGLTKEQAAGIAGNLYAESNFKLDAIGDQGISYGIAQWNRGRRINLKKFAKNSPEGLNSLNTQLEFI